MLTPRDPEEFRARVLRRAMQIERRRRRARAVLVALPALVAVLLAGVLVAGRGDSDPSTFAGNAAGLRSEVKATAADARPWSVVAAVDGGMWQLNRGTKPTVARWEDGDQVASHELPAGAAPEQLVAGTDGAIWMTDPPGNRVLRIDHDGGIRTFPTDAPPAGSATWLGGRFWFPEPTLDRITGISAEGEVVHRVVPRGRAPSVVAAGPDGAVWFASSTTARVGSVSDTGAVNELDLGDDVAARAVALTSGPGPSLWMIVTSPAGTRLARVDAQGNVVGEPVAVDRVPVAISPGPDGRLWFTAGGSMVQQRSQSRLTLRELDRELHADSWALAADDSMWAVDRDLGIVVRITIA